MVLTLGFEPSLADPQSAVLTNNTKLGWCPWRDSNPQHSEFEADASTNWTTRALMVLSDRIELPIADY